MPQSFIDTSSSIMQSYLRGRQVREQRERRLQQDKIASERLKLQEQQQKLEQKRFEDQLKATQDFRDAQLENQKAMLDFRKAVEAANQKQFQAEHKLKAYGALAKGEIKWPTKSIPSDYEGGQGFTEPLPQMDVGAGVNLNLEEAPPVWGPRERDLADYHRTLANQEAINARTYAGMESREDIAEDNRLFQRQEKEKDRALRRELALLKGKDKGTSKTDEEGENLLWSSMYGDTVPTPNQMSKYGHVFRNHKWEDGTTGYTPFNAKSQTQLREAALSTIAVKFAFDYAQSIEDWLKTGSKDALAEMIRLSRNVDSLLPQLKQGASLGVLSNRDLDLLRKSLPDISGGLAEELLNDKWAQNKFRAKLMGQQSWGMQRAIELGEKYRINIKALMGNRTPAQVAFEIEKYGLAPRLQKQHVHLFNPQFVERQKQSEDLLKDRPPKYLNRFSAEGTVGGQ